MLAGFNTECEVRYKNSDYSKSLVSIRGFRTLLNVLQEKVLFARDLTLFSSAFGAHVVHMPEQRTAVDFLRHVDRVGVLTFGSGQLPSTVGNCDPSATG